MNKGIPIIVMILMISVVSGLGVNIPTNPAITGNYTTINTNDSQYLRGMTPIQVANLFSSEWLYNQTLGTYNLWNNLWSSTFNATYASISSGNITGGLAANQIAFGRNQTDIQGSNELTYNPNSQELQCGGNVEYVTNGKMTTDSVWVKPTGWQYDDVNKLYKHNETGTGALQQNVGCTIGNNYSITFTYLQRATGGAIPFSVCGYSLPSLSINGTYTYLFTATATGGTSGNLSFGSTFSTRKFDISNVTITRTCKVIINGKYLSTGTTPDYYLLDYQNSTLTNTPIRVDPITGEVSGIQQISVNKIVVSGGSNISSSIFSGSGTAASGLGDNITTIFNLKGGNSVGTIVSGHPENISIRGGTAGAAASVQYENASVSLGVNNQTFKAESLAWLSYSVLSCINDWNNLMSGDKQNGTMWRSCLDNCVYYYNGTGSSRMVC